MMKAKYVAANGRETLLLGLSFANLDRLRAQARDGFIPIDGAELGIPIDIVITAGETEAALFDLVKDHVGENTRIHIDEKLKS
jgi:hypothetical protein